MSLLLMLAFFIPLQNQAPGQCSLSGTVVDSITSEPLNKVNLRLEPPNSQAMHVSVTTSDAEGRFALVNLEPGSYRLRGNRNGYLETSYGARRPDSDGSPVRIEAGQSLNGLNFKLTPAGSAPNSLNAAIFVPYTASDPAASVARKAPCSRP